MSVVRQEFIDYYVGLIIKQYYYKPNARGEISALASSWSKIYDLLEGFADEFDVDLATGDRLDILGRIVGFPREVKFVLPKALFGFSENPNAKTWDDKNKVVDNTGPFFNKNESQYTSQQLNDSDYQFFIKAKIASNSASAYMVNDERISVNEAIITIFNGNAYAVDNKDMTLTLYVSFEFDIDRVRLIRNTNLLPKPQGVIYESIIQYNPENTFGFSENPNAKTWDDKNQTVDNAGTFANKVTL